MGTDTTDWTDQGRETDWADQGRIDFEVIGTSAYALNMESGSLIEEELTKSVIGAFFEVYNTLGFGFLESTYVKALELELPDRGHSVRRQVAVNVMYKGEYLTTQRLDMIVDDRLVLEVKSTYHLHPAAIRQLYNYLRATNLEVGLLLHFGPAPKFYRQIHRGRI